MGGTTQQHASSQSGDRRVFLYKNMSLEARRNIMIIDQATQRGCFGDQGDVQRWDCKTVLICTEIDVETPFKLPTIINTGGYFARRSNNRPFPELGLSGERIILDSREIAIIREGCN